MLLGLHQKRCVPVWLVSDIATAKGKKPPSSEYVDLADYFEKNKGYSGAMIEMTPDEYIATATRDMTEGWDEMRRASGNIEKYAKDMGEGQKFPALSLQFYDDGEVTQEGLHRALAAKAAGAEKVNVAVVFPAKDSAGRKAGLAITQPIGGKMPTEIGSAPPLPIEKTIAKSVRTLNPETGGTSIRIDAFGDSVGTSPAIGEYGWTHGEPGT